MMKDSISISFGSRQSEATLFEQAVSSPPEERPRFLNAVSGQDPDMRRRLEVLLEAHENPETGLSAGLTHEQTVDSVDLDVAIGQTIGRYKILEKLGEGGCGVVYVAEQTTPVRRRVALKLSKLGMDTKSVVARFDAER